MRPFMMFVLVLVFAAPCYAQDIYRPSYSSGYERFGSDPYRYATSPPKLYSGGKYIGELSSDRYAPDSISNPYGKFGSRYSPDSVNNAYGPYGRYRTKPVYIYPSRW